MSSPRLKTDPSSNADSIGYKDRCSSSSSFFGSPKDVTQKTPEASIGDKDRWSLSTALSSKEDESNYSTPDASIGDKDRWAKPGM